MSGQKKFDKVTRDIGAKYREDSYTGGEVGKVDRFKASGYGEYVTDAVSKDIFNKDWEGRRFTDSNFSNRARSFYEQKVAELGRVSRQQLLQDKGVQPTTRFLIGAMYMFVYEPKGKMTLPYYDKFPLVLYMKKKGSNFMGLNIHYLNYVDRFKLLKNLMTLYEGIDDDFTKDMQRKKRSKIRMDVGDELHAESHMQERIRNLKYDRLKGKEKYELHAPCLKVYHRKNIKSKIVRIDMSDWPLAAHLPVEHFVGAPKQKIFHQSRITANFGYQKGIRKTT